VDQRNHGRSFHSPAFDYADLAADLKAFMQQQHLDSAFIIGHSMGGKAAMQFAFRYPDQTLKLVIIDIANKDYPPFNEDIIDALISLDIEGLANLKQADELLRARIPDMAFRLFLMKNLKRSQNGQYRWQVNLKAIQHSIAALSGQVNGKPFGKPCLFVRGEISNYISDADWAGIKRDFPAAEQVTIPGAGHWVHIEAKDLLVEKILNFLKKK
jgi:pimeloyl-ACP methyl ester carboxylesterase